MRSLGEFVGHIAKAVRTPVVRSDRTEVSREVAEEHHETDGKRITLRRTVVEEVVVEDEQERQREG